MPPPIAPLNRQAIQSAWGRLAQVWIEDGEGDRPMSPSWIHPQWPWDIHLYDQVTSTNSVLWHLWQRFDREPGNSNNVTPKNSHHQHHPPSSPPQPNQNHLPVAIARQQTQGKGQWSRQWHSPPGGLYLSAGLALDIPVEMKALLTLSTAWGIAEGLARVGVPIGLKWPNDLVVGGKKLGGILIETRLRGDRISRVVVGVGMNWSNPVPDTGVSLHRLLPSSSHAMLHALNDVAALVLLGIQAGMERWRQEGSGAIAPAYATFWVNRGQWVSIPVSQISDRDPHPQVTQIRGQIRRIHESGSLVVHIPAVPGQNPSQNPSEILVAPGTIALGYGQQLGMKIK